MRRFAGLVLVVSVVAISGCGDSKQVAVPTTTSTTLPQSDLADAAHSNSGGGSSDFATAVFTTLDDGAYNAILHNLDTAANPPTVTFDIVDKFVGADAVTKLEAESTFYDLVTAINLKGAASPASERVTYYLNSSPRLRRLNIDPHVSLSYRGGAEIATDQKSRYPDGSGRNHISNSASNSSSQSSSLSQSNSSGDATRTMALAELASSVNASVSSAVVNAGIAVLEPVTEVSGTVFTLTVVGGTVSSLSIQPSTNGADLIVMNSAYLGTLSDAGAKLRTQVVPTGAYVVSKPEFSIQSDKTIASLTLTRIGTVNGQDDHQLVANVTRDVPVADDCVYEISGPGRPINYVNFTDFQRTRQTGIRMSGTHRILPQFFDVWIVDGRIVKISNLKIDK